MFGVSSLVAKLVGGVALIALVGSGAAYVVHEIRRAERAEIQVATLEEQQAQLKVDHDKIVAGLEANLIDTEKRLIATGQLKGKISAQTRTAICAGTPAIHTALDGLREQQSASAAGKVSSPK